VISLEKKDIIRDEKGSIGLVFTIVIFLAMFAFMYILIGYGMDYMYDKNNEYINEQEYYSQDRADSLEMFFKAWKMLPIVVVVLMLIVSIFIANRDKTGDV